MRRRETKRIAGEGEPVVVVELVVEPIQVHVALGIVPPLIRNVTVALEGNVRNVIYTTAPRPPVVLSWSCI